MNTLGATVVALSLLMLFTAPLSLAAERGRGREHEVQRWRQGDIRRFHEEDLGRWRGGHWFHGEHFGALGWWWVVDGAWYLYPDPIYPYPDPYVPPPIVSQNPSGASTPQYWYYCPSVKEYYPYVTGCPEGWTPVVPQPTPPPAL